MPIKITHGRTETPPEAPREAYGAVVWDVSGASWRPLWTGDGYATDDESLAAARAWLRENLGDGGEG